MIVDNLLVSPRYSSLVPGLHRGFEFLTRGDLAELADGKHTIDGDRLFVVIARSEGRGRQASPLEFHTRYIDLQYIIGGTDLMGWQSTKACQHILSPYDQDKDIGFFKDEPQAWFPLEAGNFAIFFPDDAHAPLAGEGLVHKAVIKVAVDYFSAQ